MKKFKGNHRAHPAPVPAKYRRYEAEKQRIVKDAPTPEEYEREIKLLARRHGV